MNCKNCNSNISKDSKFCKNCGLEKIKGDKITEPDNLTQIPQKTIRAVVTIIIVAVAFWVSSNLTKQGISFISNKSSGGTELTYSFMKDVADIINKELPRMIDTETRLDSVIGMENSLTYKYTLINFSKTDISEGGIKSALGKDAINLVCTTPEMEIYRKNKAVLNYSYYDKDNIFIEQFAVNTAIDCF